jgi:hypothetical protein
MSTDKMHRYVIGWGGLMATIAITLPIGMMRVSQTDKFADQPFTSYDCAGQVSIVWITTSVWECFQKKVAPLPSKK